MQSRKGERVRRSTVRALCVVVATLLLAFVCHVPVFGQGPSAMPKDILIGASSPGGTLYAWGAGMSALIKEAFNNEVSTSVTVSGGTVHNVILVNSGKVDIGLSATPTIYEAFTGTGWAAGQKMTNIRAALMAYPFFFHIYTLESKPIKTVRDLNGKNVAIGEPGSSHNAYSRLMFDALGIKPKALHNLPWSDAVGLMKDGLIDACIETVGVPNSTVMELEASHKVRIVPISGSDAEEFIKKHAFFSRLAIPGGTYKCAPQDLPTVGGYSMVLVNKELSEEFVYEFVKAAYERKDILVAAHRSASALNPANAVDSVIPIHKGALRYYKERGISIPDRLVPPEAK